MSQQAKQGQGRYAAGTTVPVERPRAEIEQTVRRYGAAAFSYAVHVDAGAVVEFVAHDRHVRFLLPLPDRAGYRDPLPATASGSPPEGVRRRVRRRWRALANAIKAKLEEVESGIVDFERESSRT